MMTWLWKQARNGFQGVTGSFTERGNWLNTEELLVCELRSVWESVGTFDIFFVQ
jgi:hypothetical protein